MNIWVCEWAHGWMCKCANICLYEIGGWMSGSLVGGLFVVLCVVRDGPLKMEFVNLS